MSQITREEFDALKRKVDEIYHNLGFDGSKIISMKDFEERARRGVGRFVEKRKGRERKTEKGATK
jgi:hypothetical protein